MQKISYQRGTTLIEIMVAIVVMAIGLLGLASLQVNALKHQKTASQRSEAVQAAYDLGERMRANWIFTTPDKYTAERTANETITHTAPTTLQRLQRITPRCQIHALN